MKVLIDADGCPVVDEVIFACRPKNIEVIILCDTSHQIERSGSRTITVSKGMDSVDFALVNLVKPGDLVITQDYGLAAMCLAREARALRQDGLEYTKDNIEALLTVRYEHKKVRMSGGRVKGPSKRKQSDTVNFLKSLNRII
mgnify:CR=1 FL=1